MQAQRPLLIFAAAILALLLTSMRAEAHKLGVQCKPRGDRMEVTAYFDDDTPAGAASVRVQNPQGDLIAEGVTDEEGRWSFARPDVERYLVVVDAGAGHRKELRIGSDDHSENPSREQFTQRPWLKLAIGVSVLGGVGLAFWISRRTGRAR